MGLQQGQVVVWMHAGTVEQSSAVVARWRGAVWHGRGWLCVAWVQRREDRHKAGVARANVGVAAEMRLGHDGAGAGKGGRKRGRRKYMVAAVTDKEKESEIHMDSSDRTHRWQ